MFLLIVLKYHIIVEVFGVVIVMKFNQKKLYNGNIIKKAIVRVWIKINEGMQASKL